jgi:nucleotide-binding universal stress UspA family protein
MLPFRRVMFATDFSPLAHAAGAVARDIARESGAVLQVVHVVPPVTETPAPARLRDAAAALGTGPAVETVQLSGRPATAIAAHARDHGIDLIVVGTHGRTGVSRALLGSVAEAVVRHAPCPVLCVPRGERERGGALGGAEGSLPPAVRHRCLVCATEDEDMVCERCRTRIRGEALERKIEEERPGRHGTST